MTAIRGVSRAASPRSEPGPDQGRAKLVPDDAPSGRALVPVRAQQDEPSEIAGFGRTNAAFLAHLIATDRQFAQTRARRRATPNDAIAAYAAAGRLTPKI